MITLGITNVRPGNVQRGYELGRGRGVLDRWEARFFHYKQGSGLEPVLHARHVRALVLPRMMEPLEEHLDDGLIYQRDHFDPLTFVVTYKRYDS
jgi:hypothetical protein